MLSEKVIDRCRWGAVALIMALVVYGGCTKHTEVSQSASPASNRPRNFSLTSVDGKWWLNSAMGQKFFSLGVCVVDPGESKEDSDPENPGYAAWQHYQNPPQWAMATAERLKSWGFTTAGGWSDYQDLRSAGGAKLLITPVLHMGSTSGLPWWDMWNPKHIARMDEVAREKILAVRDDPRLLGYYSDNELGWWNSILWKGTLDQASTSGQRRRLIGMLHEHYRGDWKKLMEDFESDGAQSWEELGEDGMLYLRGGGKGIGVMRQFLGMLAERYYALVEQIIRKYDKSALILGDRYQSFYYPQVARACARHVDVVSTNLSAAWNDGSFPRFQLDTLGGLAAKPILVSEIYLAATENRSGNRNSTGNFPVVATQADRARAARNTIERLARRADVVGMDWFQYSDEPTHGRYDGENYNFGLVDIHDQPYEELTGMLSKLDVQKLKASPPAARVDASSGIPPAPSDPFENFVQFKALKGWDRERGFVIPASDAPLADLYVCWKPTGLYLGLYGWDLAENGCYRGGLVPKEDRAQWSVRIAGKEIARARIGAGREAMVSEAAMRVESIPVGNPSAWMTAAMEVPAKLLGKDSLTIGDEIELECVLIMHARAQRIEWKGRFRLID